MHDAKSLNQHHHLTSPRLSKPETVHRCTCPTSSTCRCTTFATCDLAPPVRMGLPPNRFKPLASAVSMGSAPLLEPLGGSASASRLSSWQCSSSLWPRCFSIFFGPARTSEARKLRQPPVFPPGLGPASPVIGRSPPAGTGHLPVTASRRRQKPANTREAPSCPPNPGFTIHLANFMRKIIANFMRKIMRKEEKWCFFRHI